MNNTYDCKPPGQTPNKRNYKPAFVPNMTTRFQNNPNSQTNLQNMAISNSQERILTSYIGSLNKDGYEMCSTYPFGKEISL